MPFPSLAAWLEPSRALPGQSPLRVFCVNPGMEQAEHRQAIRPVPGLP